MSSTSWEQQGWELPGGATKRVARSTSGTKASHCANKGKAWCIAISLACRRSLPLVNFTPSTLRQWENMALVQSCGLRLFATITNFACILPTPHPLSSLRGVRVAIITILTDIMCNMHRHLCARVWTCTKASVTNQACVAPHANQLLACGTPNTAAKSEEVMVASMCVRGTIWCNNYHHSYLASFCTLSRWCLCGQRCTRPTKKGQDATITSQCFIAFLALKHRT